MIKLPREVVLNLVRELQDLTNAKDNASMNAENIVKVHTTNEQINSVIATKEQEILSLQEQINNLKTQLLPEPEAVVVDENKIEELTNMLVLSGYFKLVKTETEEYLEETGEYESLESSPEGEPTVEPTVEETSVTNSITITED